MIGSALVDLLKGIPWFAWIAIVAIIGGTISSVVKARYRHVQRMEMINKGMDPTVIQSKLDED
jgi:uncharacterized membrane protein